MRRNSRSSSCRLAQPGTAGASSTGEGRKPAITETPIEWIYNTKNTFKLNLMGNHW